MYSLRLCAAAGALGSVTIEMSLYSDHMVLRELRRYVPFHLQWLVHELAEPLSSPRRDTAPGAVLFFDIAGFTALTERYAQRGAAGLEALSEILNTYFETILSVVAAHGGDVTSFAGDAMLILWRDADLARATERAAQCSLALKTQIAKAAAATAEKLQLKIAVDAGETTIVYVGVGERWDFYLGGSVLSRVCAPDLKLVKGLVTLTPAAARLLAPHAVTAALPDGWAHLERLTRSLPPIPIAPPPLPPDARAALQDQAIRRFIPAAICARIEAGQSEWLAELRQATVLFINLPGITADTSLQRAQEMAIAVQQSVGRYEGRINQLAVDDKGVTLVLACGLPPLTHEDDALRGTLTAMDVHGMLTSQGARVSIGIATGRLYSGTVGKQGRRLYAMIGDVMNRSARLMQTAAGGILVDEATRQAALGRTMRGAGSNLYIEPLPPIRLKGLAEPVPVYRPARSLTLSARTTGALIGRVTERRRLTEALDQLSAGESSVLVLVGEAGEGKSRLLDEVRAVAQERGVRALHGAADAIETTTAYVAFRSLLLALLGIDNLASPEARAAVVRQHLASHPALLARASVLQDIVPLGLLESDDTRGLVGEGRAAVLQAAVVDLLSAAAPVMLTIEDTHWMDSASWALLLSIVQAVSPLLLVLTTRPLEVGAQSLEERGLRQRSNTTLICLGGLAPEHTAELLCARLGVDRVPAEVTRFICQRTEGNAFFTEQLALALRDAGLLVVADGRCTVARGVDLAAAASVPSTVEGVVTQRLDRLSPTEQLCLKVASVVGRAFSSRVVNDIFPLAELKGRLAPHLEKLVQRGLTTPEGSGAESRYLFRHVITQEVTYNLMLSSQRRELHRSVASWYERNVEDLTPYYPLLAHHFVKAQESEPAIEYLIRAGDQALAKYACEEAVSFFADAARLDAARPAGADPARQSRCAIQMGHASYALGRLEAADAALRTGVAASQMPMPRSRLGLSLALVWQVGVQLVQRRFPVRFPAIASATQNREVRALADAFHVLSKISYVRNDSLSTAFAALRSLDLAQRAGPSAELAVALGLMSVVAEFGGMQRAAADYDARARGILQQVTEPSRRASALHALSLYRAGKCDWTSAAAGFDEAVRLCEPLLNCRVMLQALQGLARVNLRAGRLADAADAYQRILELGRRVNDCQSISVGLAGLLQFQSAPHHERCDERIAQLQAVLQGHTHKDHLTDADVLVARASIARALHRQGRGEQAEEEAWQAGALALRIGTLVIYVVDALLWVAEVHVAQWKRCGDADGMRQQRLKRLSAALDAYGRKYSFADPLARRIRAELHWLQGRVAKAAAECATSLSAAQARQMPYEVARCHHALGEHLPAGDPRRDAHLAKARILYRHLGTRYDLAALDALE